mgnify:CR=1 FL=1
MVAISIIIGTIASIFGILLAIDTWVLPEPKIRPFIVRHKRPTIKKVYAPLDEVNRVAMLYGGMAVGILSDHVSQDIEKNTVIFRQEQTGGIEGLVEIAGSHITGGSHAPGPTVLTVAVPSQLTAGDWGLSIRVGKLESNRVVFKIMDKPLRPTLEGFCTTFASQRASSGASSKRIVIGGYGFSIKESENKVIFTSEDGSEKVSTPKKVRGDALLGVEVPEALQSGRVKVKVQTNIGGNLSPVSDALDFTVIDAPKLHDVVPYVRPKEELRILGSNFDDHNAGNNWVILEPYQERKPIALQAKSATANEIVVKLPKRHFLPGPYDIRVVVDGNYSINTLILDIQKNGKRRPLEKRKD